MKLKFLKEYNAGTEDEPNVLPVDSVIELEDEVGAQLIADGVAIEYDEKAAQEEEDAAAAEAARLLAEETERLRLENETKSIKKMDGGKAMKNVFGKALKEVAEGKATGMSGNAVLAGTEATEVLGVIAADSVIYQKARKVPISGNLNVIYSKAASGDPTVLPQIGLVAEGNTGATTIPMGNYEAIPGKWFATVAVTSEMLEDVPSLEQFVIQELRTELGITLDNSALNGEFTNNIGLKGVIDDVNALQADFASFTAPELDELTAMTAKVNPMLQGVSEWYISPTLWGVLEDTLLPVNYVSNQLIKTGKDKELLGYPVNLCFALPSATPIVFGDFSKYIIGERKAIEITRDDSVHFNTDEVALKVRVRLAGGLAAGVRTYEGNQYAAIVYGQLAGS